MAHLLVLNLPFSDPISTIWADQPTNWTGELSQGARLLARNKWEHEKLPEKCMRTSFNAQCVLVWYNVIYIIFIEGLTWIKGQTWDINPFESTIIQSREWMKRTLTENNGVAMIRVWCRCSLQPILGNQANMEISSIQYLDTINGYDNIYNIYNIHIYICMSGGQNYLLREKRPKWVVPYRFRRFVLPCYVPSAGYW